MLSAVIANQFQYCGELSIHPYTDSTHIQTAPVILSTAKYMNSSSRSANNAHCSTISRQHCEQGHFGTVLLWCKCGWRLV